MLNDAFQSVKIADDGVLEIDDKRHFKELTALEQQNGNLSQVEVNEVASLVRYIRSKVSSNNAMPCWVVFFVKFLLNVCGNVL